MAFIIYRNMRWNTPLAFYMGLRGIAVLGLGPILVINLVVSRDDLAVVSMLVVAVFASGFPFVRTLLGKVWIRDQHLYARNPFRTVRLPMSRVGRITTRALWQNFFVVAAVEKAQGGTGSSTRLVAVPASDIRTLVESLDAVRRR